jgi:hypothetical protein
MASIAERSTSNLSARKWEGRSAAARKGQGQRLYRASAKKTASPAHNAGDAALEALLLLGKILLIRRIHKVNKISLQFENNIAILTNSGKSSEFYNHSY